MSKNLLFTDENGAKYPEWTKTNLGEIGYTFTGLSGKTKEDFGKGSYTFITYMNVYSNKVATSEMVEAVDVKPEEKQNVVLKGDILFTTSSETAKDVGRASLWNFENPVFLNSFCFGFRIESKTVDHLFLVNLMHSPNLRDKISKLGQGSTRINISKNRLMNLPFYLPSLPEQKKIAEFFSALDERIDLQTQKVALLKEQKKGYQQRVFNRELVFTDDNGNTYPEWEEKKLGEVAECLDNKRVPLSSQERKDIKGKIPYYGATGVVDYINNHIFDESLVLIGEDGADFANFATKPIAQFIEGKSWVNNHAHVFRPSTDSVHVEFLYYSFAHKDITRFIVGGSRAKLNKSDALTIPFGVPSLPEQEKIVEFFSALDKNIELNERKLTLLKEQKKGYLQGIFG